MSLRAQVETGTHLIALLRTELHGRRIGIGKGMEAVPSGHHLDYAANHETALDEVAPVRAARGSRLATGAVAGCLSAERRFGYEVRVRLHLIDGTYELFRAYYSKRPGHQTPEGWEAKGVVGLVSSLLALLHDEREAVSHIGIAFDNPVESFRNELFAGYKNGEGMDPVLYAQFGPAEEAVRALGLTVWSMDRWEADDALATAAARFADAFDQVRIMTPDKDLGQCIRGRSVVQIDRMREKEIDEEGLLKVRGVAPASIPDLLALIGDAADGIPGLPGIGEKTAAALLARYRHLDAIPADPKTWDVQVRGAPKIAATLAAMANEALLYRRLATLVLDVPLPERLEDLAFAGVPRLAYETWCDRLGLTSLKTRPKRWSEA